MNPWAKALIVLIVIILIGGAVAATMGWIDIGKMLNDGDIQKDSQAKLQEENNKLKESLDILEQQLEKERELRLQLEQLVADFENKEKLTEGEKRIGEKDYRELGSYYAAMKPSDAATILGKMAPGVVAEILMGMDKEEAGEILAVMEPERAAQVTEIIASSAAQEGDR